MPAGHTALRGSSLQEERIRRVGAKAQGSRGIRADDAELGGPPETGRKEEGRARSEGAPRRRRGWGQSGEPLERAQEA